ncbi:MAG: hypothetical protein V3W00_03305 [Candidatus Brocadiales bacterium]
MNNTVCPTCKIPEPLFDLKTARMLIPVVSVDALKKFLSKHKDEFSPRYTRSSSRYKGMRRLLTGSEIQRIRSYYVYEGPYPGKRRNGSQNRSSAGATKQG